MQTSWVRRLPSCPRRIQPPSRLPRSPCGSRRPSLRVLVKEPHHLRRGVGALGVSIRAGTATTGPGVSEPVDVPTLRDLTPGIVPVNGAGIGVTAGHLTLAHGRRGIARAVPVAGRAGAVVREQVVSVARVDGRVAVPVEDYRRHGSAVISVGRGGATAAHGGEGGGEVAGGAGANAAAGGSRGAAFLRVRERVIQTDHPRRRGCTASPSGRKRRPKCVV